MSAAMCGHSNNEKENIMYKFKFGEVVRDKLTGEQGCVMVRAYYYTGCVHYGFQPERRDKDGEVRGWQWEDEVRLERVPGVTQMLLDPRTETETVTNGPQPNGPSM